VRKNSWATGTNPKVNSLYLRILKHNPRIRGHNFAYSESGATIDMVAAQADTLLETDPNADLIVIQVMDSDMTCPVEPAALADFRAKLTATLRKLGRGAPNSSQFVVSQFGSVPTTAKALSREERASFGGTGPCDFTTPTGKVVWKKVARLERAIHAYERALKAACNKVRQCTYDGGAFGRIVDRREYPQRRPEPFLHRRPRQGSGRRLGSHAERPRPAPHSLMHDREGAPGPPTKRSRHARPAARSPTEAVGRGGGARGCGERQRSGHPADEGQPRVRAGL
jgi:hypothetical protein